MTRRRVHAPHPPGAQDSPGRTEAAGRDGQPLRRAALDSILIFPAVAVAGAVGLITVVVLGKFFSPAQFGHFTLAYSTLLLLTTVGGLWLTSSLLRLIPQYRRTRELHLLVGTAFAGGAVLALLIVALSVLSLLILRTRMDGELYQLLWLGVLGAPFLIAFGVIQAGYRANGRAAAFSVLTLFRVLGGFLLGLVLALQVGWGPAGMLAGLIMVAALVVLWHAIRASRWLGQLLERPVPSRAVFLDMVAFSAPIVGLNISALVLSVSDRFVIEGYLTARDVGLYSVGYAIAEGGMRLISNAIQFAVNPVAYNSWETRGELTTYGFIEQLFRFYALIAIPAVVGLSLLGKEIVVLFTTPEYSDGAKIIPFVGVALLLHGYALLMNIVFDAVKRTTIPFLNFAAVGLFNVVANVVLVPRFGFEAAAWTTTASYVLLLGLTIVSVRKIHPLRFWGSYLWKALVASAAMAVVILRLRPAEASSYGELVITIAAAVLSYAVVLVLVRGIGWSEIRLLFRGAPGPSAGERQAAS